MVDEFRYCQLTPATGATTLQTEGRSMTDTILSERYLTNLSRGLVAVGGLNWGLVGLFDLDLVATLFGEKSRLSRTVYGAVGAATAYTVYNAMNAKAA